MSYLLKLCTAILISLPVYLLVRSPWKRKTPREWALGAFVLFMTGLLALTFEGVYGNPVWMLRNAARRLSSCDGVNLIPFRSIGSYFANPQYAFFAINMIGNIVMFVSWGFGLMLLWKKNQRLSAVLLHSLALPVFIETIQLFIGRSVDVDDIILNFAGGCLGAAIYRALRCLVPQLEKLARD